MDFYSNFVQIVKNDSKQVYALCPFHKEKVPSFTINTETHQWYCHGCGEGGGYVSFLQKYCQLPKQDAMDIVNTWNQNGHIPFPEERTVVEAHRCLKENDFALQLAHSWGFTDKVIDELSIGFSNAEKRYYFPIRNCYGFLVNIRKYMPIEFRNEMEGAPKCVGYAKVNHSRLWPQDALADNTIYVVEGEKDCVAARSKGLNAITGTGGAGMPAEDYSQFKNKKVYIMTDNDEAGEALANKYIGVISPQTNDIKRIRLPVKDFTEYVLKYNDANVLQYASLIDYDVQNASSEAKRMTLVENESVENMGERVILDNMIVVGSDPQTYAIPSVVKLTCNCEDCRKPCKLYGGKTSIELAFEDRDLVFMIDSTDKRVTELAQKACNCKKINVIPTKYVNAQRVVFQEKAALMSGLDDASFEPRYGFYMYDKKRLEPTAKYVFDATRVTDPRTQKIFFSIKGAQVASSELVSRPNFEYFQKISSRYSDPIAFLQEHYDAWMPSCRVYGRLDLFSSMLLTMCSATEIPYMNGLIKGTMDVLAIGDTRTGKSLLAQNMLTKLNVGGYVNGENARLTGVLGGVVRMGDSWLITWGAMPLNDKGFLTIDEASGLSIEDISQLSSVRSGSVATINKVVRGEARARTRLFWITNPRSGRNINEYFWKGFGAFQEFIPVNEDQARYDFIIGASRSDIDTIETNLGLPMEDYVIEYYRSLIKYMWQLPAEFIHIESYDYLHKLSKELCDKYAGGTLLIKEAAYEKILRVSCAMAALAGSFNDKGHLLVSNKMLEWGKQYLEYVFERPVVGYSYYVQKLREENEMVERNASYATALCTQYPALQVLLSNTKFKGSQMAEVLGLDRDAVSKLLSQMLLKGLIKMTGSGLYSPSPSLINIMRNINGGCNG